jgi:cell division protein ZapA (FtsZ GTPase activity inhibitor)
MEKNRADVVICGASYVLSSDKSEERIKDIAKMVDEELRSNSRALNVNPNYKAAVLTALNIAERLMDNTDMLLKLQTENYQLDNDVKHYIAMWEQTKKQVTDLKEKMSTEVDRQSRYTEDQKKLQEKLVEMENAYFDLQMENVNLKNELKSIKRLSATEDEF